MATGRKIPKCRLKNFVIVFMFEHKINHYPTQQQEE
jgi:hypothetical protein